MAYALEHLDKIKHIIKQSPLGLFTDVDGTISHLAPTPQQAQVTPRCRQYLDMLHYRLDLVAVISGRAVADLRNMVAIDGIVYIGNHGMEYEASGGNELPPALMEYLEIMAAVVKDITPKLPTAGILVEPKGISVSIHYRHSPEHQAAEEQIMAAVQESAAAKQLNIVPGKMVINLVPPVSVNKGTATQDLIRDYRLHSGIYLGDDVTDFDAFRAIRNPGDTSFQGLAIGIISTEMPPNLDTEVDFTLNGVSDVERFLYWMTQVV